MATTIKLSEADFKTIKVNLIEFLGRDESPFKSYNFKSSALSGILDVCAYTTSYLASYLNMSVNDLFMQTAVLEKSIYSLMHNFNYIPKLNGPAKTYMKVRYYRNMTNDVLLTLGAGEGSSFAVGEIVTGDSSGATGTVDIINTDDVYVKNVTGTFSTEAITGSIAGSGTVASFSTTEDPNSSDDDSDKKFTTYFNYVDYTDEFKGIPTFRDKYVENQYETLNIGTDDVTTENKAIFNCVPYVDTDTNTRYLQTIMPFYQAEWQAIEMAAIDTTTFEQAVYLSDDGTISGTMYGDKVIEDTIRVFVKEGGVWYEYLSLRLGLFDYDTKRAFQLKYSEDYGIYVKFNVDGYARSIQDTEDIRIFFAVTEGDGINEEDGVNLFSEDASNLSSVGYTKILLTDSSTGSDVNSDVFEMDSGTVITGIAGDINMQMIASGEVDAISAFFTDGTAKQGIEDIRESAPLFYSTQGRAVTENDFNFLLKKRYTEYANVRAWGGQKEFVDIQTVIDEEINFPIQGGTAGIVAAIKNIMGTMYKTNIYDNPYLTVRDVTQESLEAGEHVRDKGYVYYSIQDNDFKFETNTDAINDVKTYLEKFKILSIYEKHMYPTYAILQPNINIKLKSAYTKTFDIRDIKQKVFDNINALSKTDEKFYISSLFSLINVYVEVDYVQNISYTVNAKVKSQGTDYTYVRLYVSLEGEINTSIVNSVGIPITFVTEEITDISDADYGLGKVLVNSVDVGRINYKNGIMRFQYDFGVSEYYIEGIPVGGNRVLSIKDCFYGVEYLSDITISVE
jgi:hypothetical protein